MLMFSFVMSIIFAIVLVTFVIALIFSLFTQKKMKNNLSDLDKIINSIGGANDEEK